MKHLIRSLGLGLIALVCGTSLSAASAHALLLVSVDGLRPDYVLDAERLGYRIPNLRQLLADGVHADGVRGVLPTATYPSHTSLITGTTPARHGIVANHPFDGAVKDLDVWYYYAEDIHVPTLWDVANEAGYVTASVSWPVTVGARSNRWNIPEFLLTRTAEDVKLTRGTATLIGDLERPFAATTPVPRSASSPITASLRWIMCCTWMRP